METSKKDSIKENESCRTRNSIRLGCSSIHEYIRKLQKEIEKKNKKKKKDNPKKNEANSKKKKRKPRKGKNKRNPKYAFDNTNPADNNPLQRCTLCSGQVLSCEHILLQCNCKPKTAGLNSIITSALRTTNSGITVTDWNLKAVTARILAPEFWTKDQNNTINTPECRPQIR